MAMDGVGILDSDFAHDIYHRIMDMYHNGESRKRSIMKLLNLKQQLVNWIMRYLISCMP